MEVKDKISEIKDTNRKIAEDAAYEWWHSVDKEFVDVIDAYVNGVIYGWNNPIKLKEVELENELDFNAEVSKFINTFYKNAKIGHKLMIRRTAKYFYDLGLKAKGE